MILIADGGSTKTEWRLINDSETSSYSCAGINPFFNSKKQIIDEIKTLNLTEQKDSIKEVYFYGAGLTKGKAQEDLEDAFRSVFRNSRIYLNDDLTAAGRALFAEGSGIACILGTGSNSCLYINGKLKDKVPALGYILGDEGSGADIGKRFLNDLLKRKLSKDLSKDLINNEGLEMNKVLDRVYRERLPNRFLASMTKQVKKNLHHPEIRQIVLDSFNSFIEKNILGYSDYREMEIGFVGSVAWHFKDELEEVLTGHNLRFKKIIKQPVEDLVIYHRNLINNINNQKMT